MQLQRLSTAVQAAVPSSRRPVLQRPRTATAAAAAAVVERASVPPALAAAQEVVQQHGGWFAPQVTDQPELLIEQNVPFLTTQAGRLPEMPRNLNHALYMYGR